MMNTQFLIAAPSSGAGKTTLTLGLLRALSEQGFNVQPFKCGPDYIDGKFHQLAAGKQSVNLDLFMMSKNHIRQIFSKYNYGADVSIVEGVMGLFDGAVKNKGSSAEIAKTLNLPVILVVDAKATAYSVAATLYGFKHFDPVLNVCGVIFNNVNSHSHYKFLKNACQDVNIPSLGHLPMDKSLHIPSRHLGLTIENIQQFENNIASLSNLIRKHIDLNQIVEKCRKPVHLSHQARLSPPKPSGHTTFAVARDEAFTFTYIENLNKLESLGKVSFFSPLHDKQLPEADWVYLSGGYPETHLAKLAGNQSMKSSIKRFSESGGRILAECGSMMYLGKSLVDKDGKSYPMAGVFNYETTMTNMKLKLGYRKVQLDGNTLKGHEFHYSSCNRNNDIPTIGKVFNAEEEPVDTRIYIRNNTIASYLHFYWGEGDTFKIIEKIVESKPVKT